MSDDDEFSSYHHPTGQTVDIVGIEIGGNGRNCECHVSSSYCRAVLHVDAVICFHCIQVQIQVDNKKKWATEAKPTPAKKQMSCKEQKKEANEEEKVEVAIVAEPEEAKEEDVIGVYWVSDGIDRCLVGFLPYHLMFCKHLYDGKLAQVI